MNSVLEMDDMESYDMFIDLSFLRLCKMYKELKGLKPIKKRRVRRWSMNPINRASTIDGYQRRDFVNMDDKQFIFHTRLSKPIFIVLLNLMKNSLQKSRQKIYAEERLAITLIYLAHGTPIQTIAYSRKLGKTTVRNIILDTCVVLWRVLSPKYVRKPSTSVYRKIEEDFNQMFNIPNCIGAVENKQVTMRCPTTAENKDVTCIVLSAACNANNTFVAVNVLSYGKDCSKDLNRLSPFGQDVNLNEIPIPASKPLSVNSSEVFPHYFIANAPFRLASNIIWPYSVENNNSKRIAFNNRLSPVRRVTENSFGVLSARWRILLTTIECLPEIAESIVLACTALHNFSMINDREHYCPNGFIDNVDPNGIVQEGEWRNEIKSCGYKPLRTMTSHARNTSEKNKHLREELAEYFLNEEVPQ